MKDGPILSDTHNTCASSMTTIVNDNQEIALVDQRNGVIPLPLMKNKTADKVCF